MAGENRLVLHGKLVELDALRRTPAGVQILKFRVGHESGQSEAGSERIVNCEVTCVAFEREARLLASAVLGSEMTVSGFIERKGRSSRQLVLHATHIEFA